MNVTREVLGAVGEGESVLCHGPPLSGKREFLAALLTGAATAGYPALFVTTDEAAAGLFDRFPNAFPPDSTAVVDCTGTPAPETDHVVETVGSAADLTGIAVAVSKALDALDTGRSPPVVVVDSLTTLSLYTDFPRVFRFVHSFVQQIQGSGGVLAMTVDDDSIARQEYSRLRSLVGMRVEFRNAAECRLVDREGSAGEWSRLEDPSTVTVAAGESASGSAGIDATTRVRNSGSDDPTPGSLAALVAAVREDRPRLTLGNVPAETDVEPLVDHAARHGVAVEEVRFAGGEPAGVAMIHDGATLLATGALRDVLAGLEDPFDDEDGSRSPVLASLPTDVFAAVRADRRRLLRASRTIERLALRHAGGTVHAGFQMFSRLTGDADTLAVYERLLEEGVTVHLYGELDATLPESLEDAVVRGLPAQEVSEAWFVVFDGDGDSDAGGALVTRELEPGRYDGFWSYDGRIVDRVLDYFETEYAAVDA